MLKQLGRHKMSNTKKLISTNLMQDMNFLSLKDFYNSIPDYSDINHLPEKEFYRQLAHLKKKQQELTKIKKKSSKDKLVFCEQHSRFSSPHRKGYTERISFVDDLNSENSWKNDHIQHNYSQSQSHSRNSQVNPVSSSGKLHSAMARPKSNVSEMAPNCPHSRISQVVDDYETLKHLRSKSISPTRSQLLNEIAVAKGCMNDDEKFYSDVTNDKLTSLDHPKTLPAKTPPIPITSRIPLYEQINADQEHKNQLAKMDSAIKLQSKMKPFHFSESKSRCLSRSFSSPQLKIGESDMDMEINDENSNERHFKAKPFPKNMFCNFFHYKMWEDNYFRSMNKKLRAEELLKLSKLPPSMAKREKFCKIEENLADCSRPVTSKLVELPVKKKKFRKKARKGTPKPKKVENLSQYSRSYIFDSKKDYHHLRDKSSVKSDLTSTTTTKQTNDHKHINEGTATPLYPVNRPNLAATLRYEWSREKMKLLEKEKEMIPQELCRRPNWGVKQTHAWQTMNYETSNEEEISMRLATRRAEQQLRQEEHELNMALMNQRVKSTPLLLEGPTMLSPRLGHISHQCQVHNSSKKYSNTSTLQIPKSHSAKGRPGSSKMSSYSTDSKGSSTNSKCT